MTDRNFNSGTLLSLLSESDYTSHDPYDGLLSPVSKILKSDRTKRLFMHAIRLSPFILRSIVGVPKIQMVTTLGLALGAMNWSKSPKYTSESERIAELIVSRQNEDGGWGYEFDVVLRWGSYKAGTSNLIATAVCVKALLESGHSGDWADKVESYIESTFHDCHFGYSKAGDPLIHNANLFGAFTLVLLRGPNWMTNEAVTSTLRLQEDDGSWRYGENLNLGWIDNFHSAYVLEVLMDLSNFGFDQSEQIAKGLEFWMTQMFTEGTPKYFSSDKKVTKDINTLSAALSLCSHSNIGSFTTRDFSSLQEYLEQQLKTALREVNERQPKLRWDYGPAALALAIFENQEKQ
jgi:hypothetical protein